MPSSLRDPKKLTEWLELDYTRRPRRFQRLRRWFSWVAFLGCSGALLAVQFTSRGQEIYEAGPVSTAHALFHADCQQCHTEAWMPLLRAVHGDATRTSTPDASCLRCHDGPAHHPQAVTSAGCASCHREHRGHALLARVGDAHCTACHEDLHTRDGSGHFQKRITSFTTDHPPFGVWRKGGLTDPGTIAFNHAKHLQLPAKGLTAIAPEVARLQAQQCAYCHQTGAPAREGEPRQEPERRSFQPLNYDKHCAACHPLTVQLAGDWQDNPGKQLAREFGKTPVPHPHPGETAAKVRDALRGRLLTLAQTPGFLSAKTLSGPEQERPIPGWRRAAPVTLKELDWMNKNLSDTERRLYWVNAQVNEVERRLFDPSTGCAHCHQEIGKERRNGLPAYAPPRIPERWLPHGRFNHHSHRLLNCAECHPANASTKTSDVLLPGIDNCKKCHTPQGGARGDCAECHQYHDRARDRGLIGTLKISEVRR